ncbi:hypothetical protein EDL96_06945 [Kocuria soli]|uniref:O-antigen ligase domain-containing protein n=1 Tax=Kocuria soli TaxID=2485125 RepID=A0A3N3ZQ40_9MICC|nr:hypothetical protein [Kocuria soli]ROZ63271.1 hypothetical protein EDL96_06945 [Kocuria soli]
MNAATSPTPWGSSGESSLERTPTSRREARAQEELHQSATGSAGESGDASLPEAGTLFDRALSALLILLSAFPFAAIPLGGNTNVPMSSLVAGILVLRAARHVPLLVVAALFAAVPFFSAFIRMFYDPTPLEIVPVITWVAATLALPGAAAAVIFLRHRTIAWLSWTLIGSAGYAVVQKHIFIELLNRVPFAPLYEMPGYANLLPFEETFLTYVRRPFGFFPETSFMVGTVTLMAMVLIVLLRHYGYAPGVRDWVAVGLAVWATAISGSGSAVFVLAAVVLTLLLPVALRRAWIGVLGVPAAAVGAYVVARSVLEERASSFNWSWADRGSSIQAVFKHLFETPGAFWGGMGRGRVNEEFLAGHMPTQTFTYYNEIKDIFSVTGRLVAENGFLVGGAAFLFLALLLLRSGGRIPVFYGIMHVFVWGVISGGTITYDNAFWLWGGAGVCLGLELTRKWPEKPVPDHRRIPTVEEVEAHLDRELDELNRDGADRRGGRGNRPDDHEGIEEQHAHSARGQ